MYTQGGRVEVTFDGENYPLRECLERGLLTPDAICEMAETDHTDGTAEQLLFFDFYDRFLYIYNNYSISIHYLSPKGIFFHGTRLRLVQPVIVLYQIYA